MKKLPLLSTLVGVLSVAYTLDVLAAEPTKNLTTRSIANPNEVVILKDRAGRLVIIDDGYLKLSTTNIEEIVEKGKKKGGGGGGTLPPPGDPTGICGSKGFAGPCTESNWTESEGCPEGKVRDCAQYYCQCIGDGGAQTSGTKRCGRCYGGTIGSGGGLILETEGSGL